MSSVRVGITDVAVLIDDGVDPCARAVRQEVPARVLHVVRPVLRDDLSFEHAFLYRAEHF